MKLEEYNEIVQFINNTKSKCPRTVLSSVISKFSNEYQYDTIMSIFLTCYQRKVKSTYHSKTRDESLKHYYKLYKDGISMSNSQLITDKDKLTSSDNIEQNCHQTGKASNCGEPGFMNSVENSSDFGNKSVLINIANDFEVPPCLMARIIVEQYLIEQKATTENKENFATSTLSNVENCQKDDTQKKINTIPIKRVSTDTLASKSVEQKITKDVRTTSKLLESVQPVGRVQTYVSQTSIKNKVSSWMKDPFLISNETLCEQVLQCVSFDVCYGPINDAIRHSVGLEFEEKLVRNVKRHNLPFLDENDLRKRGYDKTPDVKLEVPISVNGYPVCWIESKASFGDLQTHSEYLRDQYYSYWNRFGPGIVIYWFGFVDEIFDEMRKLGILVMDDFPSDQQITFMNS